MGVASLLGKVYRRLCRYGRKAIYIDGRKQRTKHLFYRQNDKTMQF